MPQLKAMLIVKYFLSYFTNKVESIRASITTNTTYFDKIVLTSFILLSYYSLSSSPPDIIPTKFVLKVMDTNTNTFAAPTNTNTGLSEHHL